MNVMSVGYGSVYEAGQPISPPSEPGCCMLLLARTDAVFTLDGAEEYIPAGTLILCGGGTESSICGDNGHLICDWVCFAPEGDRESLEAANLVPGVPVKYADPELVSRLIRSIAGEFYSLGARRGKNLELLLRTLLFSAADPAYGDMQQSAEPHYSAMKELREKIYRTPQLKWNVDAMAAEVNMSRSYFQHIYRELFGVSCMTDVINSKIEKAKEILSETSCTVSQVAAMCGYDNEEHFMRQFKKTVGVTPTRYRKK